MNFFKKIFKAIWQSRFRFGLMLLLVLSLSWWSYRSFGMKQNAPTYQTAQAQRGTLVVSTTTSGQITSANNVQITIQASGVVKSVLVKNGDYVAQGQTIATLTLDQASQQKQAAAWANYLAGQNSVAVATAKFNSLQAAEFTANQKFMNDAVSRGLSTTDPTYIEENANWLQAEADYKNQQSAVAAAQASLASAALTLSQVSSMITAPAAGIVKGLTITPGAIVTVTSSNSSSNSSSQVLGSIYQPGPIQAQVSVSEIDSVKISEGEKATMTLDAFPDQTFTGRVVSINTNGLVSSGVTTYPAVISFDLGTDKIYPNMAVTATIITKIEVNVLLVPNAAVQTSNGQSTVRVLNNGQINTVNVSVGDSNDSQTVITSGLNEGETVVTNVIPTSTTSGGTSPFGAIRGVGGFGGGAVRVGGRGG